MYLGSMVSKLFHRGIWIGGAAAVTLFSLDKNRCHLSKFKILAEVERKNPNVKKSCIIVVGTTGTGKSSTIAKYTGQTIGVSKAAESKTRRCDLYTNLHSPDDPVWIDTVGYDDTFNATDEESFREVLRFIDSHDVKDVHAVIWTILPQERRDQRLQRQADFINQFGEEAIWNNTIIVAKQPGSFNLEQATQGAVEAARNHAGPDARIRTVGFTYLDDSIPGHVSDSIEALPDSVKNKMLLVTDQQVRQQLGKMLDEIERPVQVVFRNSKCVDCGEEGDRRLLGSYCHMESLLTHPEPAAYFHPQARVPYHPLDCEAYHSGVLRLVGGPHLQCEAVRNIMLGATPVAFTLDMTGGLVTASLSFAALVLCNQLAAPLEERWTCCGGLAGTQGCKDRWRCCKSSTQNTGCCHNFPCCQGGVGAQGCQRKFKCCSMPEGSAGCTEVCKKCGAPWGSVANQCFKKTHNLVEHIQTE